jgi:acetylglutamate kinase
VSIIGVTDVTSHDLGQVCNLFALEVAARVAGDLEAEVE